MLVLKDIEYLQLSSFQDCVSRFLPTAKHIYIIYGIQWITLFDAPCVDGVKIHWYSEHRKSWTEGFANALEQAKSEDVLLFIDPCTLASEKIFVEYREQCEKLERFPVALTTDTHDEID